MTFALADCVDVVLTLDWRFTRAWCAARVDNSGGTVDWFDTTACRLTSGSLSHTRLPADGCSCYKDGLRRLELRAAADLALVESFTPRTAALQTYARCLAPGAYVLRAVDDLFQGWWGGTYSAAVTDPATGATTVISAGLEGEAWTNASAAVALDLALPASGAAMAGNAATRAGGGAIFWDEAEPAALDAVSDGGNAAVYGPFVATPARSLAFERSTATAAPYAARSGYEMAATNLSVLLLDSYGTRVSSEDTATVKADLESASGAIENVITDFYRGRAEFTLLKVTDAPGADVNVSVECALRTLFPGEDRVVATLALAVCVTGEERTALPSGLTLCVPCAIGAFNRAPGGPCEKCPDNFECAAPGASLETLPLTNGFMRMRATSDVALECADGPSGDSCPAPTHAAGEVVRVGCAGAGHSVGAKCAVCEDDYFFDADALECTECGVSLTSASPVTVISIAILLICFAGLIYVLVEMAGGSGDVKKAGKLGRLRNKLKPKFKIIFVGFNIMMTMPGLLPNIKYPVMYRKLLDSLDFFTLDISTILPFNCRPGGSSYYDSLLLMTIAPVVLIVIVLALASIRKICSTEAFSLKTFIPSLVSVTVLVTYLVLPAVTTTILRVFDCETLHDPKGSGDSSKEFLRVDLTLRCEGPQYSAMVIYGTFCALIYPIGVPIMFYAALHSARDKIDPFLEDGTKARSTDTTDRLARKAKALFIRDNDIEIQHLQLLYGPFEPEFYMWEVGEMMRRLLATSALLVMGNGAVIKLFWSITLGLLTVKYYSYYAPFTNNSDDTLAETINWVLVLVFLGTLAAYMEALDGALGAFLIGINVVCFGIIVVLCYSDINREKAAVKYLYGELKTSASRLVGLPAKGAGKGDEAGDAAAKDKDPEADVALSLTGAGAERGGEEI